MAPRCRFVLLICVGFALAAGPAGPIGAAAGPPPAATDVPELRLPKDIVPIRQSVSLTIDPAKETFVGTVELSVAIDRATDVIWLHARGLSVRDAEWESDGLTAPLAVTPGNEQVVGFRLGAGSFDVGTGRLRISYKGVLSRQDMEGLFTQQEGDEWYAFTQFQPLGARRAFPCFDEPSYKIPWRVTLTIPHSTSGFSNAPAVATRPAEEGMKTIEFKETKPLPSYLVAVAVGPFDIVDAGTAGRANTPIRILVPRGRSADAGWAIEATPKTLTLLEDYFDSAYPYEKLDQVAVPVFFGAMENAGLITYGQTILLQKEGDASIAKRRFYVTIAAHELAHQWFGNLVTTAWWDDLWLNEGFASWMGERVAQAYGPEWGVEVERVWDRSHALSHDSLSTARRIRQPIESAHDVANAFDPITYSKGRAVLEMFEAWLGDNAFRTAVRQYIRAHAWGTATSADFVMALGEVAGRQLVKPLASFLDQAGAPKVSIGLTCSSEGARLILQQAPFRPLGAAATDARLWQVPVCIRYEKVGSVGRECTLLSEAEASIPLATKKCPTWLIANDRYAGYYRSSYDEALLARALESDHISTAERVGLLTDMNALVASGDVAASTALAMASRFVASEQRHVLASTMDIVEELRNFVPANQRETYRALVRKWYTPRARALGWAARPEDSEDTGLLRKDTLRMAGVIGQDPVLVSEALTRATGWLDGRVALDPDLVESTLQTAAQSGDRTLFERLYAEVKQTSDRERREHVLSALGAFRAPTVVPGVLAMTLDDSVDLRESIGLIFAVASDPSTRQLAYDFLTANYDRLMARLPKGSVFEPASFLPFVGAGFCDESHREEVERFFAPRVKDAAGGPRNLAQALEHIDLCIAQRRVHEPSVAAFLRSR